MEGLYKIFLVSLLSVTAVSLISFIGVFALVLKKEKLKNFLIYFVSFSAGALFGDVFFHFFPKISEEAGFTLITSLATLSGIFFSFFMEKIICWRHCHLPISKNHIHSFAYINLLGDFFHNILDGIAIGIAYLTSISTGVATTLAVIFHEIPQEIGDLGILLHGGFIQKKALAINFLTALTAFLGLFLSFFLFSKIEKVNEVLIPFTAGNFIYIAGSDLIPELHKETTIKKGIIQLLTFIFGLLIMYLLLFIGE